MLTKTDFNGQLIEFDYNVNNKLTRKDYPDGTFEAFTYTAIGRQDTVIDARGTTINYYDSGNRLTKAVNPDGSAIEYQYDTMGNRTAVIVDGVTTSYTFDEMNRLKTVTDPDGGMTTYAYNKNCNRESVIYPNGTLAEYTYDSLNRLTKLFNRTSTGDTISCYEYTLGISGNRTRVEEHTGRTVDYSYDDTYKLTGEIIDDPVFGAKTISYTYNAVGNRLTKTEDGSTTTYVYDDNDRLIIENLQPGTCNYSYDDNGNTLSKIRPTENISYGYDYNNRLISVDDGTDIIAYAYDTDGMRVQKTVNGNVTNYLLDKNRDYAQVLKEVDGSGNTIVAYTYGDDLISQNRNSSLSYFHYDGQLSTRQLTDASAQITDEYMYDAFGLLLNRSGSTINDYMYTGEQYDPNVGFYYLRARYYNPVNGRFLTMDIWPGMRFEPMSLHKYLYCEGGPVGAWDFNGYFTLTEVVFAATYSGLLSVVFYTGLKYLFTRELPELWEYGAVFGFGFITGGLSSVISLTLAEAATLAAIYKVINAALWYGLRYAYIENRKGNDITAFGFILSSVTAALAQGIGDHVSTSLGVTSNDLGAEAIISSQKALFRSSISVFIREFMYCITTIAPKKYREIEDQIEMWIKWILDPDGYLEENDSPPIKSN